jgi:photosystem II stability/assembly factor-like uncharacterized protein
LRVESPVRRRVEAVRKAGRAFVLRTIAFDSRVAAALCVAGLLACGCRRSTSGPEITVPSHDAPSVAVATPDAAGEWANGEGADAASDEAEAAAPAGTWVVRNPGPSLQTLFTVAWLGGEEAWAAGAGGTVVRSTDGGRSWKLVAVPLAADWIAVGRAADGAIWLAGSDGAKLRSTDGTTWETIAVLPPDSVAGPSTRRTFLGRLLVDRRQRTWLVTNSLERLDGRTSTWIGPLPGRADAFAWATETRAFSGGGSFELRHLPVTTPGIEGTAIDHTGFLSRSDDGGVSWPDPAASFPERYVRFVVFAADGSGVALGGDAGCPETNAPMMTTADGGVSWNFAGGWTEAAGNSPAGRADLCVPDEREKRLRCTWDGGKSWFGGPFPGAVPGSETDPDGRDIAARDLSHVVAVGAYGRIYRAEGERWVSANDGPVPHLADVALSGDLAVAVGETSVLLSPDRGATWTVADAPLPPVDEGYEETFRQWSRVDVPDPSHVRLGTRWGNVVVSDDGGTTWQERSSGLPLGLLGDDADASMPGIALLRFLDANRGFATTRRRLFATTDAGRSWAPVELPGQAAGRSPLYFAVLPSSPGPTILLSDARGLWRSADGGVTFADVSSGLPGAPTYFTITGLVAHGAQSAWLLDGARVLRSEDGGSTWTPFGSASSDDLWPIGAAPGPADTLEIFYRSGVSRLVARSESRVESPIRAPVLPGVGGTRVAVSPSGRILMVGASGMIATLDR